MLDDFREWLSDNLRYILLGLAIILVVIILICIVRVVTGGSGNRNRNENQNTNTRPEVVEESVTEAEAAVSTPDESSAKSELVRNDTAVLTLVQKYYDAVAEKDIGTLSQIVDPWNDSVQEKMLSNDVVESYNNISTYSKQGLDAGSHVVFVYAEDKVSGFETLVPSLSRLYLVTGEGGDLVIKSDTDTDSDITDYINKVTSDADVRALRSDVTQQYEQALESDPELKEFLDSINGSSNGSSSDDENDADGSAEKAETKEMMATAGLNIRETASTEANILGSVYPNTNVTVLEIQDDGWVHISYDTQQGVVEGYVRIEYLTDVPADNAA